MTSKKTWLCCFFLSKSPGSRVISFQIKPSVAFGLPDLLTELFYIGMPVVRTDSRVVSRSVYGHVITKFSWMGRLPHFLSNGATPTRGAQLLSLWKLQLAFSPTQNNTKRNDSSIWFGREKKVLVGVLFFWGGSVRCLEKISRKKDVRVLHSFQHLTSNTTRKFTNWRLSHDTAAGSHHSSALPSCRNLNLRFVVKTTTLVHAAGKFSHRFWSLFSSFHK